MRLILVFGLIAFASTSPLVDKKQGSNLRVIDVPADLFADAAENIEEVRKPDDNPTIVAAPADIPEIKVTPAESEVAPASLAVDEKKEDDLVPLDKDERKTDANDTEDVDRPSVFGFRLPTVIILRRPAVFDNPFSLFPSFPSFHRRPFFGGVPDSVRDRDGESAEEPSRPVISADVAPSEQRPVSVDGRPVFSDIMHNMRQQMDSLFSSLFAPNPGYYPNRQFFPRPFFPPVPVDSDEDESLDFGKLPDNYNNSTSETKVVDGQVIQVNKTVHKISGNNSNGFFHFSIIKIRPSDAPETEEKPAEATADSVPPAAVEIAEGQAPENEATTIKAQQESEMNNPSLNEIEQSKEPLMTITKYETDVGLLQPSNVPVSLPLTREIVYDFVPLKSMPLNIDTAKNLDGKTKPHDLSSDLKVNNLMAKSENERLRSLVDPDEIEIIEV